MQAKSRQCAGCRVERGAANGRWRGGRTRHKRGYVLVYAPGHLRAKSNPYVFEHILVVEELLGRYLAADETIHHRNGVRDDNRPENLELWTRPHPAASASVMPSRGRRRSLLATRVPVHLQQCSRLTSPEHSWRWRESNLKIPSY
jgi:hypothetical protein